MVARANSSRKCVRAGVEVMASGRQLQIKRVVASIPGAKQAWRALASAEQWLHYICDYRRYSSHAAAAARITPQWKDRYAILGQATAATEFDRHYVYHTSWAARILARTRPKCHVDISS